MLEKSRKNISVGGGWELGVPLWEGVRGLRVIWELGYARDQRDV